MPGVRYIFGEISMTSHMRACRRNFQFEGTRKQFKRILKTVYDRTRKLAVKSLVPENGTRKVNL